MKRYNFTGNAMGIIAYIAWGILPLYWRMLQQVPALEILAHRILWSLGFIIIILALKNDWKWLKILKKPKSWIIYFASAILVSANWFTYIWAVNNAHTVDASLGYFINPLFSVLLGVIILKERLVLPELIAVLIALVGVVFLTVYYRKLPWVAVVLTITFGLYGLIKKQGPLDGIQSLALETVILFIPTVVFLFYLEKNGNAAFLHSNLSTNLLLLISGAVTATPLLLFGQAARRIPLSSLGFLQYLAPTIQFLIGILIFKEPFQKPRLIGFTIIWVALIMFSISRFSRRRNLQLKTS